MNENQHNVNRKALILVVGPTPPPHYGVAVATEAILSSTLGEEYELIHLDTSDRRSRLNFGKIDCVNVWLAGRHIAQLVWTLFRRRPALAYIPISQGPAGYLRDALFIFAAALFRARIVLHLRGSYFRQFYEQAGAPMKWLVRRSLARADRMVVLGECLRGLFKGLIADDLIRVVPNGVDPREFTVPMEAPHDGPVLRLGYLGNLFRSKGYFDLLMAFKNLKDNHSVACQFAGEWSSATERDTALKYVHDHGLGDKVEFLGVVRGQAKLEFLRSCDVFVFPTYFEFEGHPWVILEAMATGIPVVSTNHACVPETVVHGQTGLIVHRQSVAELTAAIETLLLDRPLRLRMGKSGRRRIEQDLSKEKFIERLGSVFAELIPVTRKPARDEAA